MCGNGLDLRCPVTHDISFSRDKNTDCAAVAGALKGWDTYVKEIVTSGTWGVFGSLGRFTWEKNPESLWVGLCEGKEREWRGKTGWCVCCEFKAGWVYSVSHSQISPGPCVKALSGNFYPLFTFRKLVSDGLYTTYNILKQHLCVFLNTMECTKVDLSVV